MGWAEINHFEPRSVIALRVLVIVVSSFVLLLAARIPFDRLGTDARRLRQDVKLAGGALVLLVATTVVFVHYWFFVVLAKITLHAQAHSASELLRHWRHDALWELGAFGAVPLGLAAAVLLAAWNAAKRVPPPTDEPGGRDPLRRRPE